MRLSVFDSGEVNRCDYMGMTPLHHAARKGHLHIVTFLVNWGANLFALDNDHHTALNLASLYEKVDVMQYLDSVSAQKQSENPKTVAKLKEEAIKQAERNIRRYEKMQKEAARIAEEQQRKLTNGASVVNGTGEGEKAAPRSKNFFQTLTMRFRGTNNRKKLPAASSRTYSDMAGISHTAGARGGVAKLISQRRSANDLGTNVIGGEGADFKVSDVDESGKRTLRSLSGVRGASSEVMYLTGQRGDNSSADISTSRPAVFEVWGGQSRSNLFKTKSESDLLDSGTDSYFGDEEEDEENAPGIFNRPGFGKTAFLTNSKFINTLPSFDDGGHDGVPNGFPQQVNGNADLSDENEGSLGEDPDPGFHGPMELPWDPDEVDPLDDDDETTASSPLEMFLWSAGLETYLHKFLQEKVDMELLVNMSDNDLKEIGLPFGPRKRLLEAIRRRQDVLRQPKVQMTDSFL
nr:hypothetical protein BaRGS_027717 [Batillaria attramentaria]